MWSVHQRLAELWFMHCYGKGWTGEEAEDFKLCLDANMHKAHKLADLYNQSLVAGMANDKNWLHEIGEQIEHEKNRKL